VRLPAVNALLLAACGGAASSPARDAGARDVEAAADARSQTDGHSHADALKPAPPIEAGVATDASPVTDGHGKVVVAWTNNTVGRPSDDENAETGAQHVHASTSKDALMWSPALQIDAPGDDGDGGSTPLDYPNIAINPVNQGRGRPEKGSRTGRPAMGST
jgi:hypothetical protein